MFALNNFLATSQHYFVAPMASDVKAPAIAAASAGLGFAEQARVVPMEQLTMAALVILSGLNLANSILAV